MRAPEHIFQFNGPKEPSGSGGGTSNPIQSEESDAQYKGLVADSLKKIYTEPGAAAELEGKLNNAGLLYILEEVGILPSKAKEPPANPYDPDNEKTQYKQWKEEHRLEYDEYTQRLDERDKVLRHLYIGVVLDRKCDVNLFPQPNVTEFGFLTFSPPIPKR